MNFVDAIAKTMNDLQANPVWQREALIGQGVSPRDANILAQETADKAESKQMVEMIRARLDAGQPITESELMAIGSVNPELARAVVAMQTGSGDPSNVREYKYFNSLSPEEQSRYLTMKRSSQIMNLGGTQAVYDPLTQGKGSEFDVTPKPEQMPDFKAAQEQAKTQGKAQGEAGALLESSVSKLPELFQTVQYLSDLGKKATYTEAGKAKDWLARQAGISTEGATARTEYMAVVDNQILPLLRDTFGTQFTQKEGETLRSTLGDPDKTPEQKDAVLQSFINQKVASIQSLERQTGNPVSDISAPDIGGDTLDTLSPDEIDFLKSQGLM